MEQRHTSDSRTHKRAGYQRGFSMIEVCLVVALILIISGIALVKTQSALQESRAYAGTSQLKGAMREARETAISARRTVQVQFFTGLPCTTGFACVVLTRLDPPANVPTVILTLPLDSVQFMQFAGEPDTPDGFGNAAPIFFGGVAGGPPTMEFQSDGSFTDGNGNPINGTVFLGIPNTPKSPTSVTILGGTGRARVYRFRGGSWVY